jgi:glycosyltransferase involved in cell wall biosynthesis
MKVAIIHDWLTGMRGGERCLETFLNLYPEADIFTLLHTPGTTSQKIDARVRSSSLLQHMPFSQKLYRHYLPLYPLAARSLRIEGYDLVISLSHAAAKNVYVQPGTPHLCYCFTPMRYVWDQASTYFGNATPFLWPVLSGLRRWDRKGAENVTHFIAISKFVAARIRRFYGRNSTVIYPPVETSWIKPQTNWKKGEAFLYAGALVPYKRVELLVDVFNRLGEKLWIVGDGPLKETLKSRAAPTISFFGRVSDSELADYYRRCRALIFPAKEDFGMIPVECMAAGRPVIGFAEGALRETVLGMPRGLQESQDVSYSATGVLALPTHDLAASLAEAVRTFQKCEEMITPASCIERAALFGTRRFEDSWEQVLQQCGLASSRVFLEEEEHLAVGL